MRRIIRHRPAPSGHWVGDGFPVKTLFSHFDGNNETSPFLMLDYAGPAEFEPSDTPRGVDVHPHKGFETVTIVYQGEVEHRDSAGNGGVIGPGDVQWMTAGAGVLHKEFHSPAFTKTGGTLEMVQLWVNLPAEHKGVEPSYQAISATDIPVAPLAGGEVRVIAGSFDEIKGPARTFTPMNVWDLKLEAGANLDLAFEGDQLATIVLQSGQALVGGTTLAPFEHIVFGGDGHLHMEAQSASRLLVLAGEKIDEPIAAHGPFVMNSKAEIIQAIEEFRSGKFGAL